MTCHYDPSTERYSECDGHHRCICPDDEERTMNNMRIPETVTASNSQAVMAAEIVMMRAIIRALGGELDSAFDADGDMPHYRCTQALNQAHRHMRSGDLDSLCVVLGVPHA
jgi:hypothetical protein